tara:strand:+ start:1168 stop:1647 length:480 start_codon:yes stop_codon:yes gene_type:complete
MLIYIFDLDDTIIKHNNPSKVDYKNIKKSKSLNQLLLETKSHKNYIFTNGTKSHADIVLRKLDLENNFNDIFSRENYPEFMKPHINSFLIVQDKIHNYSLNKNKIVFFDDQLENLKSAKKLKWITILIHNDFINKPNYIDFAFPNIHQALLYLNNFSKN